MKRLVRENIKDLPYSLHDGVVIDFKIEDDNLIMKFLHGFFKTSKPFKQVEGSIEIENIDWDFAYVYLIDYEYGICGNVGSFTGTKMELKTFVEQYKKSEFTLIDETYGYNTSKFDGFIIEGDSFIECMIEIYHLGDMYYLVEE